MFPPTRPRSQDEADAWHGYTSQAPSSQTPPDILKEVHWSILKSVLIREAKWLRAQTVQVRNDYAAERAPEEGLWLQHWHRTDPSVLARFRAVQSWIWTQSHYSVDIRPHQFAAMIAELDNHYTELI